MNKVLIFSIGSALIGIIIGLVVGVRLAPTPPSLTAEEVRSIVESSQPSIEIAPFDVDQIRGLGNRFTYSPNFGPIGELHISQHRVIPQNSRAITRSLEGDLDAINQIADPPVDSIDSVSIIPLMNN